MNSYYSNECFRTHQINPDQHINPDVISTKLLLPWLVFPWTVWKALLWVQNSPHSCIAGQSLASLSLCSTADLPLCAAHSEDQKSPAWPKRKKTNTSNFIMNLCKNNVSSRDATLESLRLRKKDCALWGASESYLLSPRLGVLFFSLPHSRDEFHKDSLPVFHLLYGLKSGISAMLHCKFTKCCPAKKQQCWLLGSKTTRYKDI